MEQQFDFAGNKFTDKSYNKPNLGQGVWSQLRWVFIPAYERWRKEALMAYVDEAPVTPESALVCLRGSRVKRRAEFDYNNCDIEIAAAEGAIDIV